MHRKVVPIVATLAFMTAVAVGQQTPPAKPASPAGLAASKPALRPMVSQPPKTGKMPFKPADANAPPPRPPAVTPMSGSRWSCPGTVYDFGDVWQGAQVTYRFEIKNTGKDDLQIIDAQPECHCTIAGQFDRIVKPGKSGFVPFTLNTMGLGKFLTKHATITINDPSVPQLRVELHGTVKTLFECKPNDLGNYGEVVDGEKPVVREAEITSNIDEPFTLELMPGQGVKPYHLEITEVEKGKHWHLKLSTVVPMPSGYITQQVYCRTSNPHLPTWMLYCSGFHPERIAAKPQNLLMPNVVTTATPFTIDLENHGKTAFKVLSATVENAPELTTDVQTNGMGYRILIHAPMGYQLPDARHLKIKTDQTDPKIAMIDVVLYKIVERPNLPPIQQAAKNNPGAAKPTGLTGGAKPMTAGAKPPASRPVSMLKPMRATGSVSGPQGVSPAKPAGTP